MAAQSGKMIASALKHGGLLVRTDTADHEALTQLPGAHPAEMGTGRSMGRGWISVSAEHICDDENLRFWVDTCMAYNRKQTHVEHR